MKLAELTPLLSAQGLVSVGEAVLEPGEHTPEGIGAVVMLGLEREAWPVFEASAEAQDGEADPLDRWSARVIGALAKDVSAQAFFPFGGPPYHPFLRWATATGQIWPSALGMSIHAEQGLWISFRGALGFEKLEGAETPVLTRPCDDCVDKPCLSGCPVGAFEDDVYNVPACVSHIAAPEGAGCLAEGCLARRACPVGRDWTPPPRRAYFHMSAFKRARIGE